MLFLSLLVCFNILTEHICQNEGSPCFHQKSKEEEEKKEEFSLYPNAYYPPGSLGRIIIPNTS